MFQPVISIIVPIYNAEKFIEKCLKTLIEQSYKNIEIICINDGSEDKSINIISKYAEFDERIIIVNKKNSGVSVARNHGIQIAKGEYIMFVDADDFLEKNACELLIKRALKIDADIIQFNHKKIINDKYVIYSQTLNETKETFRLLDCIENGFPKHDYIFCWDKLYKKEFLIKNNVQFDENLKYSEDFCFVLLIYKYNPTFFMLNEYLYNYNIQSQSACRRISKFEMFSKLKNIDFMIFEMFKETNKYLLQYSLNCAFYLILRWWNEIYHSEYKQEYINKVQEYLHVLESNKVLSNYKLAKKYLFLEKYKLSKIYWKIVFPIERYFIKFFLQQILIRFKLKNKNRRIYVIYNF